MLRHVSTCCDMFLDMFWHVSTCCDMLRHVLICFDMLRHVATCFNMFRHVSTCFHMFQHNPITRLFCHSIYLSLLNKKTSKVQHLCDFVLANYVNCFYVNVNWCQCGHTVILPDWTLIKWGLSNFAFQHC